MSVLAVIPARGGSKGIPRKNIHPLRGKPLIAWTIEEALAVPEISRLICSTDDPEIAEIAESYGCDVPFLRPASLAGDTVSGIAVLLHAIEFCRSQGENYDLLLNLQCTSPLRRATDIREALQLFVADEQAVNMVSVCQAEHSPFWMYTLDRSGRMKPLLTTENSGERRQELPSTYRLNGALYLAKIESFIRTQSFKEPAPRAYIMPVERSVDVDEQRDLQFIEFLLENHPLDLS
jgi:CMP-N-acetylneuraminic acid synthetase